MLNIHVGDCTENWNHMTPADQGRHCAACNRLAIDFTNSTAADLAAARATASGQRPCGRFRVEQLFAATPKPAKRRHRPRWQYLLLLVLGLALTQTGAGAQTRKAAPTATRKSSARKPGTTKGLIHPQPELKSSVTVVHTCWGSPEEVDTAQSGRQQEPKVYMYVDEMPVFKQGGQEDMQKVLARNVRWPAEAMEVEGRVFVNFIIDKTSRLREAKVLKGLHPAIDAEALRVVRLLDGQFTVGRQNKRPVHVYLTVPVTFSRN